MCAADYNDYTVPRLKCSCNYKFRGTETTTIFATNEFTWFRQNDGGEGAFRATIRGEWRERRIKSQNSISRYISRYISRLSNQQNLL